MKESAFYGEEKTSLAFVITIMNMILHGIEEPNIIHTSTLSENRAGVQEKDRYDVIFAHLPLGGKEFLFLQHIVKMLKAGGRAGVVIDKTFLSNTDDASVNLRNLLLGNCNLHTVLDCPGGTFQGEGINPVVLFFEKGRPTHGVWFYRLDLCRNMGRPNTLNDADLAEFIELQKTFANSPRSWHVDAKNIDQSKFDLSAKNPKLTNL